MAKLHKGLKQEELGKYAKCCVCHKLVGQIRPLPIFHIIEIQQHGLDINAINRQSGLESMLGNPFLAMHMGSNEDMTMSLGKFKAMICDTCILEKIPQLFNESNIVNEEE